MLSSAIYSSETFVNLLLAVILALYKPPGAVYIASFKEDIKYSCKILTVESYSIKRPNFKQNIT